MSRHRTIPRRRAKRRWCANRRRRRARARDGVRAAAGVDGDARLERALGVQTDELPLEQTALAARLAVFIDVLPRGFQRGGLGLADHAHLVAGVHEAAHVHVQAGHGHGGGEVVAALVREDVQRLRGHPRVFAVEVELVPHLDQQNHPGVLGFVPPHLFLQRGHLHPFVLRLRGRPANRGRRRRGRRARSARVARPLAGRWLVPGFETGVLSAGGSAPGGHAVLALGTAAVRAVAPAVVQRELPDEPIVAVGLRRRDGGERRGGHRGHRGGVSRRGRGGVHRGRILLGLARRRRFLRDGRRGRLFVRAATAFRRWARARLLVVVNDGRLRRRSLRGRRLLEEERRDGFLHLLRAASAGGGLAAFHPRPTGEESTTCRAPNRMAPTQISTSCLL